MDDLTASVWLSDAPAGVRRAVARSAAALVCSAGTGGDVGCGGGDLFGAFLGDVKAAIVPANADKSSSPMAAPRHNPQEAESVSGKRKWPWPLRSDRPRQRQKEQLASLLQDVRDMEVFLASLAPRPCGSPRAANEELWERQVAAERTAKRDAECRNQRLRDATLSEERRFKRIGKLLTQGLADFDKVQATEPVPYDPEKDAALYADLMRNQRTELARLEQVLADAGFRPNTCDRVESAEVVMDDAKNAHIRFVKARMEPFRIQTMMNAMTRQNLPYLVFPDGFAERVDPEFECLCIKMRYMLRHDPDSKAVPLLIRGVAVRVQTKDEAYGMWMGQGDWPEQFAPAGSGASTLPIREQGWVRMRHQYRPGSPDPCTMVQSCLHMTPGVAGALGATQAETVQMLANVVIPSYMKLLLEREQLSENFFIDEAMSEAQQRREKKGSSLN